MGKDIKSYDLPQISQNHLPKETNKNREIAEEMSVQISQEDIDAIMKLNMEHKYAYTVILNKVNTNRKGMFFVDGPGGTGKHFYIEHYLLISDQKE